ncbi:MAG: hypothetical protein AAF085_10065 [Planctomycetota bacterium]
MDDAEYEQRVNELYQWGTRLFQGKTIDSEILEAAREYYSRGEAEGFSIPELLDYLAISSPSVLEQAGFTDDRSIEIMQFLGQHLA